MQIAGDETLTSAFVPLLVETPVWEKRNVITFNG